MDGGGNEILVPLYGLVGLGAVVLLGALWARRTGRLQARGAIYVIVGVIAVIAILLWVGPALFLV